MTEATPTDGELLSKIKDKQRTLLREYEKPAPGSSAAPGGKKKVADKRAANPTEKRSATVTSRTTPTPKSYASAVTSTPSATSTSARSSPDVVHVEDELESENPFIIPRLLVRDNSVVNERLALEAERRRMQKMIEAFNQQETESEEQEDDGEDEQDWPPRRARKLTYQYDDRTVEDTSRIYTARNASKDAYLKLHWTDWTAIDVM